MEKLFLNICITTILPSILFFLYFIFRNIIEKFTNANLRYNLLKAILILYAIPIYQIIHWLKKIIIPYDSWLIEVPYSKAIEVTNIQERLMYSANMFFQTETSDIFLMLKYIPHCLWILGIMIGFIHQFNSYRRFFNSIEYIPVSKEIQNILKKQKKLLGLKSNVKIFSCINITTPMLVGIMHPKILLPVKEMEETILVYTIRHELIHLQRKDLYLKLFLKIVHIIYWFNPIFYLLCIQFEKELEYSCDEIVVKDLSFNERKKYGFILLNSVQVVNKAPISNLGLGFSTTKQKLQRRIENMLKYKDVRIIPKIIIVSAICSICIISLVPVITTGNIVDGHSSELESPNVNLLINNTTDSIKSDNLTVTVDEKIDTYKQVEENASNSKEIDTILELNIENIQKIIWQITNNYELSDFASDNYSEIELSQEIESMDNPIQGNELDEEFLQSQRMGEQIIKDTANYFGTSINEILEILQNN